MLLYHSTIPSLMFPYLYYTEKFINQAFTVIPPGNYAILPKSMQTEHQDSSEKRILKIHSWRLRYRWQVSISRPANVFFIRRENFINDILEKAIQVLKPIRLHII